MPGLIPKDIAAILQCYVGRRVRKLFGRKYYTGVVLCVSNVDVNRVGGYWWRIRYEDGDSEDVTFSQLKAILVEDIQAEDSNNQLEEDPSRSAEWVNEGATDRTNKSPKADPGNPLGREGTREAGDITHKQHKNPPSQEPPRKGFGPKPRDRPVDLGAFGTRRGYQSFAGRKVRKCFNDQWCNGQITSRSHSMSNVPGGHCWHIEYTNGHEEDLNLNELLEILVHYEDTGCKRKARHQDSELKHGEDSDAVGHEENKPFDRNGASSSYADEHRNSPCSGQSSVSGTLLVNVGEPAVQSRHEIYSLWM